MLFVVFFFFSSRRRHTRLQGDWSSDVCSSDLEGLGPSPVQLEKFKTRTIVERMDEWIGEQRNLAGRTPRRYASSEDAFRRMQEENPRLTAGQARHLTEHGANQNEDGTYSWK